MEIFIIIIIKLEASNLFTNYRFLPQYFRFLFL